MRPFQRFNSQAVFATGLILVATVYASQIPKLGMPFSRPPEPGAAFFPVLLSIVLYVAAFRILVTELRRTDDAADEAALTSPNVPWLSLVGPVALVLFTALFITVFPVLGYFAAAGIYTFAVAVLFNYEETGRFWRAVVQSAITAAAITGFGWLFFEGIFGLSLPGWRL